MRLMIFQMGLALFLCCAIGGNGDDEENKRSNAPSISFVRPIDISHINEKFRALPKRDREMIQLYMEGAQRYVLKLEDGVFPNSGTEHWRNIAERAHGAAFLSAIPGIWPLDLRERCRKESVGFIKEFVAQYKIKNDMGNPWQCSWWVAEMASAAWFLWDLLDEQLRKDVAEMVCFHADRIAAQKPGAQVVSDTQAETVAWNSTILSLAVNMMPEHPHNKTWDEAAKHYVYTILSVSADLEDNSPGDNEIPVKEWVVGANLHDDFSLENHGRFHVDYLFTTYRFMIQGVVLYLAAGNPLPKAFTHHVEDVYSQVLLPCLNGSKFMVYVSDNDWRRYHAWTESPMVHGYMALLTSSPLASALEEESLKKACAYWRAFPEGFQYDNPYVCGKAWSPRIADIVLLRLFSRSSPEPLKDLEAQKQIQGVHRKHDVNLITHYSKGGGFCSFYWGPGPSVRHIEDKENAWMLLPWERNYRLRVDGKITSQEDVVTSCEQGEDWFWILRRYKNGEQEAFCSLPDGIVVIMNWIPHTILSGDKSLDSWILVEKPHNNFAIHFQDARAEFNPGNKEWDRSDKSEGLEVKSSWINLGDRMGYVIINLTNSTWHMKLPPAGARGNLSLFQVDTPGDSDQGFITIAFPNMTHDQTEVLSEKIKGNCKGNLITCFLPGYVLWANFSDKKAPVQLPEGLIDQKSVLALPYTVSFCKLKK